MANNTLYIENFGPIKKAKLKVKDFMIFIGPQSSGKSTLAKLITILNDFNFRKNDDYSFKDELIKYNILSYVKKTTVIKYQSPLFNFYYDSENGEKKLDYVGIYGELKEKSIDNIKMASAILNVMLITIALDDKLDILNRELIKDENFGLKKDLIPTLKADTKNFAKTILNLYELEFKLENLNKLFSPINNLIPFITPLDSMYIPAERSLLPLISDNLAGLLNNKVKLPNHITFAAQEYEKAEKEIKEIDLSIAGNLKFKRINNKSYIYHNKNQKILLSEASSGVQTLLPLLLILEISFKNKNYINLNYVVEEPELNLFPEAQYQLLKHLTKNCLETNNNIKSKNLIITTHSPYILSSVNNLLLSYKKGLINKEKTNEVINSESWVNPLNFDAYEVKNGKVRKIFNNKIGLIEDTMIDEVSEIIMDDFKEIASIND